MLELDIRQRVEPAIVCKEPAEQAHSDVQAHLNVPDFNIVCADEPHPSRPSGGLRWLELGDPLRNLESSLHLR